MIYSKWRPGWYGTRQVLQSCASGNLPVGMSDGFLTDQGPELQCLLRVKEDLSYVLIFQDAKNNV